MTVPITVLMSVYNGERWLKESIDSVLKQTFTDFEFLIVNDGSEDSSLEVINSFVVADERIRVISKPNTGLANSLNQGIHQAKGGWIARIDADDICDPKRLELQYTHALLHKAVVLIGTNLFEIDEVGRKLKTYRYPCNHSQLINCLLRQKGFFAHSSAFYRTKAVKSLGGYRPRVKRAQDFDLWLRLSDIGEIACIDKSLVSIRKHAGQISHDEGGRRQLVDSRLALVSYFLRQRGIVDPVDIKSVDNDFAVFRQFVEREIELDDLVKYRHWINQLKIKLLHLTMTDISAFLTLSGKSPHFVLRYFKEMVFGEKLSLRLVNNWLKKKSTCVD